VRSKKATMYFCASARLVAGSSVPEGQAER